MMIAIAIAGGDPPQPDDVRALCLRDGRQRRGGASRRRPGRTRSASPTFALSGTAAALAGTIDASRVLSAQASSGGSSSTFTVLTGIIVGGTSILGGEGSIRRTVVGCLFVALVGERVQPARPRSLLPAGHARCHPAPGRRRSTPGRAGSTDVPGRQTDREQDPRCTTSDSSTGPSPTRPRRHRATSNRPVPDSSSSGRSRAPSTRTSRSARSRRGLAGAARPLLRGGALRPGRSSCSLELGGEVHRLVTGDYALVPIGRAPCPGQHGPRRRPLPVR